MTSEWDKKAEETERQWMLKFECLEVQYNNLKAQLEAQKITENEIQLKNIALKKDLAEVLSASSNLKQVQLLFMDWTMQQEYELPPHICDRLPKSRSFLHKAAFKKVPYGKSPAEYAFNLLYFLSLSEEDQIEAGAKVFQRVKDERPENFASLENIAKELHEFLFFFPDENIKMKAAYGFLQSGVPKFSTNPRSTWVVLKNLALNLFPVYTRVTVRGARPMRSFTATNLRGSNRRFGSGLYLEVERMEERFGRKQVKVHKIKTNFDLQTGMFELSNGGINRWEIKNYGMADYRGEFIVSNLAMDNNPPYEDGMMGIVQILWTGICIYDSCED